jgi:hypothetical protein
LFQQKTTALPEQPTLVPGAVPWQASAHCANGSSPAGAGGAWAIRFASIASGVGEKQATQKKQREKKINRIKTSKRKRDKINQARGRSPSIWAEHKIEHRSALAGETPTVMICVTRREKIFDLVGFVLFCGLDKKRSTEAWAQLPEPTLSKK